MANFVNSKVQKEWLQNQQKTKLGFRECVASTNDLHKYCVVLNQQNAKIEQKLISQNVYSYGQELWLHFTAKSAVQDFPTDIYFTAYDNLENSIFSAGLSYFEESIAFFNISNESPYKFFIWNSEYTHSIDITINREGNTSFFVDNRLVMEAMYAVNNSIESITFTATNGNAELEFGNIIIDSDPSQMVEQNVQDLFVFRDLEKEELIQLRIMTIAHEYLGYEYTPQMPKELKEKHTPNSSADPRRFVFPFQIGYTGTKKEGYFKPNEEEDSTDSEDDEKAYFEL